MKLLKLCYSEYAVIFLWYTVTQERIATVAGPDNSFVEETRTLPGDF